MTATETRLHRPEALAIARSFIGRPDGCYTELTVAGSLRRRLAWVHDVEIVAVPRIETHPDGLFEDRPRVQNLLEDRLQAMLDDSEVERRRKADGTLMAWGPTWKSVTFHGGSIDLFSP